MRKAVQAAARRNQRRRENPAPPAESPPTAKELQQQQQQQQSSQQQAPQQPDGAKRKATPEDAALTAKNYRLAKELVSGTKNKTTAVVAEMPACLTRRHKSIIANFLPRPDGLSLPTAV